jgi:hypothetical protein
VLAARCEVEPREKWYRHYQSQTKQEPSPSLQFKGKIDDPASWIQPGHGSLEFGAVSQERSLAFVPLSSILHERYFVYTRCVPELVRENTRADVGQTNSCGVPKQRGNCSEV